MSLRADRLRLGKESATSSARREKDAQRPPLAGRRRGGGTRFGRADDAEVSSSQVGASQIVDPAQYQHEAYQPQYEQADQLEGEAHQQEGVAQEEPRMEFEARPHGFSGGPYELSLLPNFGKHVACRLLVDPDLIITTLFYFNDMLLIILLISCLC